MSPSELAQAPRFSGYTKAVGGRDRESLGARLTQDLGGQSQESRPRKGTDTATEGATKPSVAGHWLTTFSGWGDHHPAPRARRLRRRLAFKLRSRWRLPHQPTRSREGSAKELRPGSGRWKGRDLATDWSGCGQGSRADSGWGKGSSCGLERGMSSGASWGNDPLAKLLLPPRCLKGLTATWNLLESFCCLWHCCGTACPRLTLSCATLPYDICTVI